MKASREVPFLFNDQMKKDAAYWIDHLGLSPHPEGGFYKETYRAAGSISGNDLNTPDRSERSFSTAIYFLLRSSDRSVFHRIKSDELWHFYAGGSLTIYVLASEELKTFKLGDPSSGVGNFQVLVPAGCWFAAEVNENDSYVLSGCTVAPGFDFRDFELASRKELLKQFPGYRDIVERLSVSE